MFSRRPKIFGILALTGGILLILLEIGAYRRGDEVAWFWLLVAVLLLALGLADVLIKPPPKNNHRLRPPD